MVSTGGGSLTRMLGLKRGSLDASVGRMSHADDIAVFVQSDVIIVDGILASCVFSDD
jgi:hypothetical protein